MTEPDRTPSTAGTARPSRRWRDREDRTRVARAPRADARARAGAAGGGQDVARLPGRELIHVRFEAAGRGAAAAPAVTLRRPQPSAMASWTRGRTGWPTACAARRRAETPVGICPGALGRADRRPAGGAQGRRRLRPARSRLSGGAARLRAGGRGRARCWSPPATCCRRRSPVSHGAASRLDAEAAAIAQRAVRPPAAPCAGRSRPT